MSESTLRAWERRYGFLHPARTPGGHRRYRAEDVAAVERLLAAVERGSTVAAAAKALRDGGAPPLPDDPFPPRTPAPVTVDAAALAVAHRTGLRLLHLRRSEEVGHLLVDLVVSLGGEVVPASQAGEDAMPIDLSFGHGVPLLPTAPLHSKARLRLERLLPELVEGARSVVELLRKTEGRVER